MRERIIEILRSIEAEYGVRVLYACESGSRAWGFASPDSDYDVRFVYVRPLDGYLSLAPVRDVIEVMCPQENIDLAGWDLRKALPLFAKSNPSFYEWLGSPVVYIEDRTLMREVRQLEGACFNPKASFHHYLGTAVSHDVRYLERKGITLKKFLYYFRSLLCCEWVLQRGTPPPVRFSELFEEMIPEGDLIRKTRELLEMKSRSKENDRAEVDEVLIDYANALRDRMEDMKDSIPKVTRVLDERLEKLFLKAVKRHPKVRDGNPQGGEDSKGRKGFFFSYESEGVGWVKVRIGIGDHQAEFNASYIGRNPLEEMMMAVDGLAGREHDRWCVRLEKEPGTMDIEMRKEGDSVLLQVKQTDGDFHLEKDGCKWEEKVCGKVSFTELRKAVLGEARRVLFRHGVVGFSKDWCDGRDAFPMAELLSLSGIEAPVGKDGTRRSSFFDELKVLSDLQELQELGETK